MQVARMSRMGKIRAEMALESIFYSKIVKTVGGILADAPLRKAEVG